MIHRDEREKAAADCTLKTLLFEANSRTAETILEPFLTKDLYGNLTAFIPKIHRSLVQAAQRLVAATGTGARHEYILGMHSGDPITLENVDHFKALWADMKIQESPSETKNSSLLTLGDKSAEFVEFFFSRLDEIANPDYEPSARDVVTWRAQATGLIQLEFTPPEYGEYGNCLMLDVSRMLATERRKWLPCFDRVSSVTIVVALSDYDMIEETTKTNKLVEALDFFQEIYTLRWVRDVILCLSGRNLFEEKLKRVPLNVCPTFRDYVGPQTSDSATKAIEDEFAKRANTRDKKMYTVVSNFDQRIFSHFRDIVITYYLHRAGVV